MMKKPTLNRYALLPLIAALSLLGVGTSSALAADSACTGWAEGPGTNWYYLDANYGDYQLTALLVIEINGNPADFQTFNVGDTVTITSNVNAYAASCSGGHNESYSLADLAVSGPSGFSTDTTGDIFDFSDTGCSEINEFTQPVELSISYPLTDPGTHTVSMISNAQINQYGEGGLDVSNDCSAGLSFVVVVPYTSVGDCISTQIDLECGGLKGKDRATCAKDQIGYCHALFSVPSAHN